MPQLTERSLIKLGQDSLVVVIPRGWLTFFGLKAGDKVEVETNGEIHIRPKRKRKGADIQTGGTT
jgi:AbrB family looped-hinge helix DNA binding protein